MGKVLKLNLGSGGRPKEGYINVDVNPKAPGVDVIHDLNIYPWPFEDNSIDEVLMEQCLEHLIDRNRAMKEIHRILKKGGVAKISVPHFTWQYAYADPTHKHVFTERTFNFFCPDTPLGRENDYCTKAKFKIKSKATDNWGPNLYLELEVIK